jgi:hypothetical protein
MYDSGKIIIGLVIFVGLFTSPFWYDLSSRTALQTPNLVLPTKADQKECVASLEFMRRDHMNLLNEWRAEVVRDGMTYYKAADGKEFEMRYTKTCLGCHPNTSQFCDQCHNYVGINPYCWDCHNKPELQSGGLQASQVLDPEFRIVNEQHKQQVQVDIPKTVTLASGREP